MKRFMTMSMAVLAGLMALALPALAEVSTIYDGVGGTGGEAVPVGQVTQPADPGAAAAGALAQTGIDVAAGALLAIALLVFGIVALLAARRRAARAV